MRKMRMEPAGKGLYHLVCDKRPICGFVAKASAKKIMRLWNETPPAKLIYKDQPRILLRSADVAQMLSTTQRNIRLYPEQFPPALPSRFGLRWRVKDIEHFISLGCDMRKFKLMGKLKVKT